MMGSQDGLEVRTLVSQLSGLGLNPDPVINCRPGVSQAGWFINVCAVLQMDVKLDVPFAGISWWMWNIPRFPSWRVGELSPAPWNKFQIPALTSRRHIISGAQPHPQPMMLPRSLVLHVKGRIPTWCVAMNCKSSRLLLFSMYLSPARLRLSRGCETHKYILICPLVFFHHQSMQKPGRERIVTFISKNASC